MSMLFCRHRGGDPRRLPTADPRESEAESGPTPVELHVAKPADAITPGPTAPSPDHTDDAAPEERAA